MLEKLNSLNQQITIRPITDPAFCSYGRILTGYDFTEALRIMERFPVPAEGNTYVASVPELTELSVSTLLSLVFYGGMPIQVGYCNGNTGKLNALEYHKSSEIDIAVTDLVLLLSDLRRISDNTLSSEDVEAFYVPAGTACELYGTTLHFAPCRLSDSGFKSIIVLPKGTNEPLAAQPDVNRASSASFSAAASSAVPVKPAECTDKEACLLWMRNKWLISHPEGGPAQKGAYVGILGKNIEILYK